MGKFTLKPGDTFICHPRSFYQDSKGIRRILGVKGRYVFVGLAADGIMARKAGDVTVEFIYMGPERLSPLTGAYLKLMS